MALLAVSTGTVMGIFLMAVIVLGYLVIWLLWHFVFRASAAQDAAGAPDGPDAPPPS